MITHNSLQNMMHRSSLRCECKKISSVVDDSDACHELIDGYCGKFDKKANKMPSEIY